MAQLVPKDHVMPPENRPEDFVSVCKEIPVIDLQENPKIDRSNIIRQILKASQEFGLFQVINHGVSEKIMEDIRVMFDELFNMSIDDKSGLYSKTYGTGCMPFTSNRVCAHEVVHYWKDTLKHPCDSLEAHTLSWPEEPAGYREEVGRYALEVRKIGFKILDMIGEGLGLNEGYFNGVRKEQTMVINHHLPRPGPSLTMGSGDHADPNLIAVLLQDQYGLQMHKNGKWMGVDPIPYAFVINIGYQLEDISNGKLKSVEHRTITSSTAARTSIATFFGSKSLRSGCYRTGKRTGYVNKSIDVQIV